MTTMTLTRANPLPIIQVIGGSLLLALCAQISIYLPFTPIPLALHGTAAVLLGVLLGPVRGTAAVALYLLEGAVGLPVFANGMAGLPYMLGPTGGFLIGFAASAFFAGWLSQRLNRTLSLLLGHLPLYLLGAAYLSLFVGWNHVFLAGVLPFLPGCVLKSLACGQIISSH